MNNKLKKLAAITAAAIMMSCASVAASGTLDASLILPTDDIPAETQAVETAAAETTDTVEDTYQSIIASYDWSAEDAEMLLRIAMAEAEGEDVEGKALVMLVVLNRTWSDSFPDTIKEVIFQSGQFTVTQSGGRYWTTTPDEGCYAALDLIESGWDGSQGALYFESSYLTFGTTWHSRNLTYLLQHGNHRFYK